MHMLILIERDPPSYDSWPSLLQKKKILQLSVSEIISKYQGFEGELVYFFEIDENIDQTNKKIEECLKLKELGSCFMLHVISIPSVMPPYLETQATKLGYDVGVCDEEKTIYSSIFHEVLFGYYDELVVYKDLLNENFLFPNRSIAQKYVQLHNEMSAQGKDVEDYEEMTIYEIWKYNS